MPPDKTRQAAVEKWLVVDTLCRMLVRVEERRMLVFGIEGTERKMEPHL